MTEHDRMVDDLRRRIDDVMAAELEHYYAAVPYASHLTDDEPLHEGYYLRHKIETVHRIRTISRVDALALAALIDTDYEAARWWSRFIADELGHDDLFLRDLVAHGVHRDEALLTPLLPATVRLLEHLDTRVRAVGALPAIVYALFVEWHGRRAAGEAVRKAERSFDEEKVSGARLHVDIDEDEEHYERLIELTASLLSRSSSTVVDVLDELVRISRLLCDYFTELYEETARPKTSAG